MGNGSGRIEFAGADASTNQLLRTRDDSIVVLRTVKFAFFGSCSYSASLWRFKPTGAADVSYGPTPAFASMPIVEFFNTQLDHYFITAGVGEIVGVDKGGAGLGWERAGLGFRAFTPETGIPCAAQPVCRFYGTPGCGPNSHFYTASVSECAAVKKDAGWTYEGVAFYVFVPTTGQCAAGQQPVYRAYNNRFAQNDSNHRYATELPLLQAMKAQGCTVEGVAFCGSMN